MDSKVPNDLVYILGLTQNELGGSEYYDHLGYVGLNVPQVFPGKFASLYKALSYAIDKELVVSAHGIYSGGIGVHLAMVSMGGNLGMDVDLSLVPTNQVNRNDSVLFSESPGRFLVTLAPENRKSFEKIFKGLDCICIGTVTGTSALTIRGIDNRTILAVPVADLKSAWKKPFGGLI